MPGASRTSPPDVLIVQPDGRTDHLAGVARHLRERGLSVARQDEPLLPPRVVEGTKVVVVADTLDPRSLRALRMARRVGARTLLVMDGIAEYRNTYVNPRVGEGFLRPAPVDRVCCSGLVDMHHLRGLGNDAVPTGLPRLDAMFESIMPAPRAGHVLVATARTPAFDDEERNRLLIALMELKQAAQWTRTRLLWRLTAGLDEELGVTNHAGTLWEALADAGAVVTTPSTLLIEAMRAGRPTALIHAHPTPLWPPAAWVWQSVDPASAEKGDGASHLSRGLTRFVDSPERLLRQLCAPTREQMDRQDECLTLLDASSGEARSAELVAEVIAELAQKPRDARQKVVIPEVARVPETRPRISGLTRVVSVVPFEQSPVGGVTTWSKRLSNAFAERADLGYDLHTLLVARRPSCAHEAQPLLDERTSLCVLDPTDDHFVTLDNLRRSIEALSPDVVLPNYTDIAYAAATQLRCAGARSVAIAHTDCDYYRDLIAQYSDWDAAVSVSASIDTWLQPLAADRPFERIVYGVPIACEPRPVSGEGSLRIAYVGRLVQEQKRILDLAPFVRTLAALGVSAEMHIVGDGPEEERLKAAFGSTGSVRVKFHGSRSPEWVEAFWPRMDVCVLVSAYEGTSITMLEAMGQGVVPAVTRVGSGAGEWVVDGESGVSAPVGEPEALAQRVASLAHDRARLAELGRRAWTRVAERQGLKRMAERYASVFDQASAAERPVKPTLAGVTLMDLYSFTKQHTEDGEGESAWLVERLKEAGFERVSIGTPVSDRVPHASEGAQAVVIPAGSPGPDADTLQSWEARGIRIAWSSLLPAGMEWTLLVRHIAAMREMGLRRIAVFGLGQHTQRRAEAFAQGLPVVGFIDDRPPASGEAFGLPAVAPGEALRVLKPDGVLISSDAWEREMWAQTKSLRGAGVVVRTIYDTYADAGTVQEEALTRCVGGLSQEAGPRALRA